MHKHKQYYLPSFYTPYMAYSITYKGHSQEIKAPKHCNTDFLVAKGILLSYPNVWQIPPETPLV